MRRLLASASGGAVLQGQAPGDTWRAQMKQAPGVPTLPGEFAGHGLQGLYRTTRASLTTRQNAEAAMGRRKGQFDRSSWATPGFLPGFCGLLIRLACRPTQIAIDRLDEHVGRPGPRVRSIYAVIIQSRLCRL